MSRTCRHISESVQPSRPMRHAEQEPASLRGLRSVSDGPGRDRTCDLGIKSPLLYQLSYRPAPPV